MSVTFEELSEQLDAMAGDRRRLLAALLGHEDALTVQNFDTDEAWELGCALRAASAVRLLPMAISITLGTQRAFHAALPGAVADNDAWAARKSAVVYRFGHSSFATGVDFDLRGESVNDRLPADEYAAHGGAFPIRLTSGLLVGVVAVSGLPAAHDHALVVSTLAERLGVSSLPERVEEP